MQIEINTFIQKNLKQLTNKTFSKKYISQYINPIITNLNTSKNNKFIIKKRRHKKKKKKKKEKKKKKK